MADFPRLNDVARGMLSSRLLVLPLVSIADAIRGLTASDLMTVGPTTGIEHKQELRVCDVRDYGARVDDPGADLALPLLRAWKACTTGGIVHIGPGNWTLRENVTLKGGAGIAVRLDGIIDVRMESADTALVFVDCDDLEFFSPMGAGGIQGNGYSRRQQSNTDPARGQRILRLINSSNISIHDLRFADAEAFVIVVQTSCNVELYNLAISQPDIGGTDAIDVSGQNIWIHDVMAQGKDECITIKSPSDRILVEQIHCNRSGGCAIGSLRAGTAVSNVTYRHIYAWSCNQMFMIKTNGGDGHVNDILLEDFRGVNNQYALKLDMAWGKIPRAPGPGPSIERLSVYDWTARIKGSNPRPAIMLDCDVAQPCRQIDMQNIEFIRDDGTAWKAYCNAAEGTGIPCLAHTTAAGPSTAAVSPSMAFDAASLRQMDADAVEGYDQYQPIPLPDLPTSYFPGRSPIKPQASPFMKRRLDKKAQFW